ncbi:ABC transporter permease [Lacticaseibacillus paracasei]|uniref:ABC transporter permease n=1 Tax=Lacticaseibacillus paracasei TaxID=1597 RepID=UPI0031D43E0D
MSNQLIVSPITLLLALILVLIALAINLKEDLGMTKDLIIGVVRAVIQLTVVGFVLTYIIKADTVWLTLAMIAVIIFNAAWNAKKRAGTIPNALVTSLLAITTATGLTLVMLVAVKAIRFVPSQINPICGMIASNVMVAIGLAYRSLNTEFNDLRQQVLERLALGADLKQASQSLIVNAIKTGMAPTIDSAKTVGLVSLPGMMSGLIFAGIDPTKAIMYQIMVTFMLLGATSIGSFIAVYRSYPRFYNARKQLR